MRCNRSFPFLAVLLSLATVVAVQGQGVVETTSLLGVKLYALTDDAAIAAVKAKVSGGAGSAAEYVALSKAEAGRRQYKEAVATDTEALAKFRGNADLLLERGHRELGLREFALAQKDLQQAVAADATNLDSHYHLGLAFYFQGRFAEAAVHFGHARDLAKNDDSLIDCSAWLYASLRRAGKATEAGEALTRIRPAVTNTEPHLAFYLRLLRFYQGSMTEAQILPAKPAAGDTEAELSYNTINYGVGNWHLYKGQKAAARPYFERVVRGEAWNSWGFVGAETELARR